VRRDARAVRVLASRFVLAAGAVNSAALLLRSRGSLPDGVANSSGQVGRNYMTHTTTFIVAVRPGRDQRVVFEKTLGINDWYHRGPTNEYPLGNIQSLGKLQGAMIKPARRFAPRGVLDGFTRRSADMFAQTEDLPLQQNRVLIDSSGRIQLVWKPTNREPHRELVDRTKRALRRCGYPLVFTEALGIEETTHQCGTAVMGSDPSTSVVDPNCGAHDVGNLWITDSSVFPSSAAVNPALTVAANALRVAASGELTA
jgi:choline dehydrogenase-like flavoprotein